MSSTELFKDGFFKEGPQLPAEPSAHCMLELNSTHSMMTGGYTNVEMGNSVSFGVY